MNIKCRLGGLKPHAVVLVATIKALKYHGGVSKNEIFDINNEAFSNKVKKLEKLFKDIG